MSATNPNPGMTRHERLLYGIDLPRARGIEIGPLATPIISKQVSEVYYVDHADRETLQAKYAEDPNVEIEKIVAVDALWGERTLRECFPDGRDFDYVLASHVMEHVPDMIGWLHEIAEVLKPGGRLLLVVPDKRFTFDYLRQPSRLGEVIDAYLRRNRRPMPAQIFDYIVNAVDVDARAAWEGRLDAASLKHFRDARFAFDCSVAAVREGKYIDSHCWVFTARSLAALFVGLIDLDLVPFRCVNLFEPERNGNEIDLVLERLGVPREEKEEARRSFLAHLPQLEALERRQDEQQIEGLQRLLEGASKELIAAKDDAARLAQRVALLEDKINHLITSRSFRMTRPFRQLKARFSRKNPQ
ncbi:MAG: methyltransferase domain-containing protein [Acidobacteriaceae bacterium]|nr:methyltransferase domain-containing protein [Acidobacteriaceae bacterium]MBV8571833.1 methyltransferase domain-containing protein [Acidobacteriaceae bacterium]